MIIVGPLPRAVIAPRLHRFSRGALCRDHAPARISRNKKAGGLATRRLPALLISAVHTLTSGPREAGPFDPPLGPPGFGLRGTVRLRAPGSFSGFGVTGPSTNSKPIFSSAGSAAASSLTSTTRTRPPPL